ncbi:MAG: cadmium-translocating P-type ATPase [Pigmentiphaga sp.]|nr:cadmium-translocating P-type ATPase [Pigmentiphaga sp.]
MVPPLRSAAAPSLPEAAADPYAGIDASAEREGFVRALPDNRHEAWLAVEGMVCAACGQAVEATVGALPGVESVRVSLMTQRARVLWQGDATRPSDLFRAVARAGYTPYPADAVAFETARRQASRLLLWRLLVACAAMMQVMMYAAPEYFTAPGEIDPDIVQLLRWAQWMLTLPVMLFCAWPIFRNAAGSLRRGRIGMDVPAALGIGLAFVASSIATFQDHGYVWFDSVTMFVFFLLLARWLEDRARRQATQRLEAMRRSLPDTVARRTRAPGADTDTIEWVVPDRLAPGDCIQVEAGMAFPVDGIILAGHTQADEALLTGESRPLDKPAGAAVRAGSRNVLAPVEVRVERAAADSTLGRIRQLVDEAAASRPDWMRVADRWASVFLSGVLVLAALSWFAWQWIDPDRALPVAIAILIVTCPCALSLATPSAMLAATAALARQGIWLRTPASLERLARTNRVVFDKTGTLTAGQPALREIRPCSSLPPEQALAVAAALAQWSRHPLSRALASAAKTPPAASNVSETAGGGLAGTVDDQPWWLGSDIYISQQIGSEASNATQADEGWPMACLANARQRVAYFHFTDPVRPDAAATVQRFHRLGLRPSLLSGDGDAAVARLADGLPLDHTQARLSPDGKLEVIRRWQAHGDTVVMIGDGINDGPALAAADVAVALGDGTPLARQQADLVLASARLADLATAHDTARQAVRVMRQNLAWALAYNITSVPLAMAGLMPPWAAGLGMALSSLLVIGNGLRLLRGSAKTPQPTSAGAATHASA